MVLGTRLWCLEHGSGVAACGDVEVWSRWRGKVYADRGRMEVMNQHMLLGRVSQPADHASLFVLLGSRDESPYVTGAMMLSDGGLTISI